MISILGENILTSAMALSPEERREIAAILWDSVGEEEWSWENADPEWRTAWLAEIERRMEEVRTGKVQLIDGETVMRELRERLAK
jgi:putative addiction module component (TIGR02574 family)